MEDINGYVVIEKYLITSDAFVDLKFSSRAALIHFFEKKPIASLTITFSYQEARSLGYSQTTFRQVLVELQNHGFIDVIQRGHGGRANGTASSGYVFSDNWIMWEKPLAAGRDMLLVKNNQRERDKLSLSLRYKIMRRDNFSCQICGATGKDDRLVVDHLYPVDKGGKTEMGNLRTLCFDCNRGKGNRIE